MVCEHREWEANLTPQFLTYASGRRWCLSLRENEDDLEFKAENASGAQKMDGLAT